MPDTNRATDTATNKVWQPRSANTSVATIQIGTSKAMAGVLSNLCDRCSSQDTDEQAGQDIS